MADELARKGRQAASLAFVSNHWPLAELQTLFSTSSVVAPDETLIRIAACPRHDAALHQQVPSS